MDLLEGIKYNIKGIILALKTPKLLMLGLLRFVFVLLLTFLVSGLIFYRHDEILTAIWIKPDSGWLIYFWHVYPVHRPCCHFHGAVISYFTIIVLRFHYGLYVQDY